MKSNLLFIFITVLINLIPGGAQARSKLNGMIFIVNTENTSEQISSRDIGDFYFKRKRHWPNGESVRFIDRTPTNRVRDSFLKSILNKTQTEVELFWIGQKLYSGDSAPLRESTDTATIQFVSTFKGAIGYVANDVALSGKNVKTIKVSDDED